MWPFSSPKTNKIKTLSQETSASQLEALLGERKQLSAILNGMTEGVLVVNREGELTLFNPSLGKMLHLNASSLGKTLIEIVRHKEIHESIERVLQTGQTDEQDFDILLSGEEKCLSIHTAPLMEEGKISGAVAVFYDTTPLRALEKLRQEFVANVSHELKTPLTAIRGFAETLRLGGLKDEAVAEKFVTRIEENAKQLQRLVEDLLDLSAIESARRELRPEILSPLTVLQEILADDEQALQAKQMTTTLSIPAEMKVFMERAALKQILGNLIDNAIKYSPSGSQITVYAERIGDFCKITVADEGIGIAAKDLPHIFERFYRVDKARSREAGGTGLGLSIVKHLVQAHGGTVGVTSQLSHGSQFFFTVPEH